MLKLFFLSTNSLENVHPCRHRGIYYISMGELYKKYNCGCATRKCFSRNEDEWSRTWDTRRYRGHYKLKGTTTIATLTATTATLSQISDLMQSCNRDELNSWLQGRTPANYPLLVPWFMHVTLQTVWGGLICSLAWNSKGNLANVLGTAISIAIGGFSSIFLHRLTVSSWCRLLTFKFYM